MVEGLFAFSTGLPPHQHLPTHRPDAFFRQIADSPGAAAEEEQDARGGPAVGAQGAREGLARSDPRGAACVGRESPRPSTGPRKAARRGWKGAVLMRFGGWKTWGFSLGVFIPGVEKTQL